jgi:formylglycine-generating enzyme
MRPAMLLAMLTLACGRHGFDASIVDGNDAPRSDGDGASMLPPSCVGLPASCGPARDQPCCDSVLVPGGSFLRGYDVASDGMFTSMASPVTVTDVLLDRYEVTVGRFRQFVLAGQGIRTNPPPAGAGAHPNIANSGWNAAWNNSLLADTMALTTAITCDSSWTSAPGPNENKSIDCIDWYEAMAFCAWDNGFLPTEAEWLNAASGGSEQRAYPWSNPPGDLTIDCPHANHSPCGTGVLEVGSTSPLGDGKWGHADLGGNVMEWLLDVSTGYQTPCVDCANLGTTGNRQAHGGATFDPPTVVRNGSRFHQGGPTSRSSGAGVRCARAP